MKAGCRQAALVPPHTDLSLGLLEYPHNMAADRPWGQWSQESKKEAAMSILTYLRGYARSFPQYLVSYTINPVRVGVGCTQEREWQEVGPLECMLEAPYHSGLIMPTKKSCTED